MSDTVPAAPGAPYQRILVAVDGSATARGGMHEAVALARLTGGRILLLHVLAEPLRVSFAEVDPTQIQEFRRLQREEGQAVLRVATLEVEAQGIPVESVLDDGTDGALQDIVAGHAKRWMADLLVLGTHGRRGVGRMLLGSGAERILRVAPVPVLLVRAPAQVQASDAAQVRALGEASGYVLQMQA